MGDSLFALRLLSFSGRSLLGPETGLVAWLDCRLAAGNCLAIDSAAHLGLPLPHPCMCDGVNAATSHIVVW